MSVWKSVRTRRFRLQPVKEAEAELLRRFDVARLLGAINADDWTEPVVVLRPIDDSDVTSREAIVEVAPVENASKTPPRTIILCLEQESPQRLLRVRPHGGPA